MLNSNYLQIEILMKTLQTDKKIKDALTLSRNANDKLVMIPNEEGILRESSNILNDNECEPYFIESGYLLHLLSGQIENKIIEIEGSQLSGTEGIWDVSNLFLLHLNINDIYLFTHVVRYNR